ncbi:MAG: helix-turn-helix transcriptional regulator [Nocardioidaceae bacterium]|nr:helix-turn-helix transcriptional regulator [Nocardioidaceae bacterium]
MPRRGRSRPPCGPRPPPRTRAAARRTRGPARTRSCCSSPPPRSEGHCLDSRAALRPPGSGRWCYDVQVVHASTGRTARSGADGRGVPSLPPPPDREARNAEHRPAAAVLRLPADGRTAESIGSRLGISPRTVHRHLQGLYRKLGVGDRVRAVLVARGGTGGTTVLNRPSRLTTGVMVGCDAPPPT